MREASLEVMRLIQVAINLRACGEEGKRAGGKRCLRKILERQEIDVERRA